MKLRTWAVLATLSTFALMLLGAYVVKTGAGLSCEPGSWPLCNGRALPPFRQPEGVDADTYTQAQITSEWAHRFFAGVTSFLTLAIVIVAFRRYRDQGDLLTLSIASLGLLFAQVLMGAATVRLGNAPWTVVVHQGLAMAFFGLLVAIIALAWRRDDFKATKVTESAATSETRSEPAPQRTALAVVADYVSLLKPRVLVLLLVSAVTSMLIAVGPNLSPWTIIATVVGGAMASGCGSAFNQWYERDTDLMMARTAKRPVAAGRIPPNHVLAYSASLGVGSFMVLAVFVNLLAAFLALGGALFYITVYTIWLKPSRPSNIVIGGAAGSFPVLVGWAAVTGQVTVPALVLSFIVFLWTPPHFWSFALLYKDDYARAGVPMLPVVRGDHETKQQIFLYSVALLLATTSMWLFGLLSVAYLLVAMVLGAVFVFLAFNLLRAPGVNAAHGVFRYSILYLGLLFVYMAIDKVWINGRLL